MGEKCMGGNFIREHRVGKRRKLAYERHHDLMDRAARRTALTRNLHELDAAKAEYARAFRLLAQQADAAALKAFVLARGEVRRLQEERRRLWD